MSIGVKSLGNVNETSLELFKGIPYFYLFLILSKVYVREIKWLENISRWKSSLGKSLRDMWKDVFIWFLQLEYTTENKRNGTKSWELSS